MSTFNDLVNEVRATLRGYGLVRERVSFLNGSITNSATTITVVDGTQFEPGLIEIGDEVIDIQSISGNVLTVSPDGRGFDGTTAAAHSNNARVTSDPPYPTWRLRRAINDTIVGTWPTLFGVGSTSFTYTPGVTTYSMPADAESILLVTATVLGPSGEQAEINRYLFDSSAPTSQFATGNCITLREVPEPGRTVTVTYAKAPSELVSGDNFTTSGLRETARRCIVYGAVAQLISFVDTARSLADSAVASELAGLQGNGVGSATRVAAQLTARYQLELDQEQRRLRTVYPVKIRIRGR